MIHVPSSIYTRFLPEFASFIFNLVSSMQGCSFPLFHGILPFLKHPAVIIPVATPFLDIKFSLGFLIFFFASSDFGLPVNACEILYFVSSVRFFPDPDFEIFSLLSAVCIRPDEALPIFFLVSSECSLPLRPLYFSDLASFSASVHLLPGCPILASLSCLFSHPY